MWLEAHLCLNVLVGLSELVPEGLDFGLKQRIFILADHDLVVLLAQTIAHLLHLSLQLLLHASLQFYSLLEQVDVVLNLFVLVDAHFEIGLERLQLPSEVRVLLADELVLLSQLLD